MSDRPKDTALLRAIEQAPRQALPALLLALTARMLEMPAAPAPPPRPTENGGPLLTPDDLAEHLRLTRSQVYSLARREDWRPYVVRAGRRVLRFKPDLLAMLKR